MKTLPYSVIASTLLLAPVSTFPQAFDITQFDPVSKGPWSEVGRTTLMVPKVPNGSIKLDGSVSPTEYGGFKGTTVTPGDNAWILNFPDDRTWDGYGTRYYYDMQASIRKLSAQISLSAYLSEHLAFGAALRLNNLVFDRLRIKGDSLGGVAIQNPSEGDKEAANPDWSKLRKVTLTNADLAMFFRGNLFPFYGMAQLGYSHNFNYRSYSSAQFSRLWLEFSIGLHFGIFRKPGAGKPKEWLWE